MLFERTDLLFLSALNQFYFCIMDLHTLMISEHLIQKYPHVGFILCYNEVV